MTTTISERRALEELTAAHLRGAKPEKLLELAEAAIRAASLAGDALTLESVAAELDLAAAPLQPDQGDGLRLRLAARRARATSQILTAVVAAEEGPVPAVAEAAFWVPVAIGALALFSIGAMALGGSYAAAYFLMFLLVFGSLFVAVLGAVGVV